MINIQGVVSIDNPNSTLRVQCEPVGCNFTESGILRTRIYNPMNKNIMNAELFLMPCHLYNDI